MKLSIASPGTDNGNCRVYYRDDAKRILCFQEESRGKFKLYRCTRDGEPSHDIMHTFVEVDALPTDDSSTAREFIAWAQSHISIA